jgi:hypothetical protein
VHNCARFGVVGMTTSVDSFGVFEYIQDIWYVFSIILVSFLLLLLFFVYF